MTYEFAIRVSGLRHRVRLFELRFDILCAAVACALCGLCPARLSLRIQPYRIEHYGDWRGERARCGVTQPAAGFLPSGEEAGLDETLAWCACGAAAGAANTRDECRSFARDAPLSRVEWVLRAPGRCRPGPPSPCAPTTTDGGEGVASPWELTRDSEIRRGTLSGLTSQSGLDCSSPICRPRPARAHAIAIILHRVRVTSMTAERPDMLRHRETRRAHFIRFQSTCHSRRISASDFGGVP